MVVCEWELGKKVAVGVMDGVHTSIEADVEAVLQGKTYVK